MARMPLKIPALLFTLLALGACGKFDRTRNGGFTDVAFGTGLQKNYLISSTLTYGIMIYAYSTDYATNIKISDATAAGSAQMKLPNGEYKFYAFGYGISFDAFGGEDVRCAVSAPIVLTGTSQTIHLDFRQSNCGDGAFAPDSSYLDNSTSTVPNSGLHFRQLKVFHCGTAAGTGLGAISSTQDCSTMAGTGITAPWTGVSRFQIVVPLFKREGQNVSVTGEAYRSSCGNGVASSTGGYAFSSNVRFPVGAGAFPGLFPLEVESFTEAACTSTPVAKHSFHKGLIFGPSTGASYLARVLSNTGENRIRVYLREP